MNYIYLIENNLNHNKYIGFTSQIERRKKHYSSIGQKRKAARNRPIELAIKKYGWDHFTFIIIDQHENYEYCLNILEPKYIDEYNTFHHGYNLTPGGEGRKGPLGPMSEEHKEKIGNAVRGEKNGMYHKSAWIGRTHSEESKRKMSDAKKGRTSVFKGKKHSEESKEMMRQAKLGKRLSEEHKRKIGESSKGKIISENQKRIVAEKLSKTWLIITPSGESITITNLRKFCIENHLNNGNMFTVAAGRLKQCKGYKVKKLS